MSVGFLSCLLTSAKRILKGDLQLVLWLFAHNTKLQKPRIPYFLQNNQYWGFIYRTFLSDKCSCLLYSTRPVCNTGLLILICSFQAQAVITLITNSQTWQSTNCFHRLPMTKKTEQNQWSASLKNPFTPSRGILILFGDSSFIFIDNIFVYWPVFNQLRSQCLMKIIIRRRRTWFPGRAASSAF